MGYFKTYKNQNKKTKKQKVQELMKETEGIQEPASSDLFESSIWSKRYEYHTKKWNYYDNERKNECKFVYHLGLANLAKHYPEVKEKKKYEVLQKIEHLQFEKDPETVSINGVDIDECIRILFDLSSATWYNDGIEFDMPDAYREKSYTLRDIIGEYISNPIQTKNKY